jgi:hypothetical protein
VLIAVLILIVAGISWPLSLIENHRQQRMQADRQAESLCTFARSFDCRTTDTWIVRAVYEEIARFVEYPIRADDHLERDLKIDPEDIEFIVEVVADRTSRSLEGYEANPFYGRMSTVRDLVRFFADQPRQRAAN